MLQRRMRPPVVLASFIILVLAGCGAAAEKSGSRPNASESAKTTDVKPTAEAENSASASPLIRAEPTDTRHLAQVLDLMQLPLPENATPGRSSSTHLQVGVPLPVRAAVDFYLGKLAALGWKLTSAQNSENITDSFAQVGLNKDGYLLTMTVISGEPKASTVTIEHLGNLDVRSLPRLEGAEKQCGSQASSLDFTTATVDDAVAKLRKLLKAEGWQEYDRAFAQKGNLPDSADLLFRRKAYSLRVSIRKSPAQPNKTVVQYQIATLAHDLPAPDDARQVEIEDSRWILKCETPHDLAATADYYRTAMRALGFTNPPHETPVDKSLSLAFESADHDLVLVGLTAAGKEGTKVKLEGFSAAFREAMKKALAEEEKKRETQKKAEAEAKAEAKKRFEEASKRQDAEINAAVKGALNGESPQGKPSEPSELSKQIQADVKAQLEKAMKEKDN